MWLPAKKILFLESGLFLIEFLCTLNLLMILCSVDDGVSVWRRTTTCLSKSTSSSSWNSEKYLVRFILQQLNRVFRVSLQLWSLDAKVCVVCLQACGRSETFREVCRQQFFLFFYKCLLCIEINTSLLGGMNLTCVSSFSIITYVLDGLFFQIAVQSWICCMHAVFGTMHCNMKR